jgi:hypothetical protein
MNSWKPEDPPSELEELKAELARLKRKVARLEKELQEHSWTTNPDRSGGAWTNKEISDAQAWK